LAIFTGNKLGKSTIGAMQVVEADFFSATDTLGFLDSGYNFTFGIGSDFLKEFNYQKSNQRNYENINIAN
jgi:hypothetical protein